MCINQEIKMYFVATFLCLVHLTSSLPANVNSDQVLIIILIYIFFFQFESSPTYSIYFCHSELMKMMKSGLKRPLKLLHTRQPLNGAILLSSCLYLATSIIDTIQDFFSNFRIKW